MLFLNNLFLIFFRGLGGVFPAISLFLLQYITSVKISADVVSYLSIVFITSSITRFGADQYLLMIGVNENKYSVRTKAVLTRIFFFILSISFFIITLLYAISLFFFPNIDIFQYAVITFFVSLLNIGFSFFVTQSLKVTSVLFFHIFPYVLLIICLFFTDNVFVVLLFSFGLPCVYLFKYLLFKEFKFEFLLPFNFFSLKLFKVYLISLLSTILTNIPVLFSIYIDDEQLTYDIGLYVRFIGLTSFLSTIIYTLYAREIKNLRNDFISQLKYFFYMYFLIIFAIFFISSLIFYFDIFVLPDLFINYTFDTYLLFVLFLLFPLITLGNIIGFLLLVKNKLLILKISLLISVLSLIVIYFLLYYNLQIYSVSVVCLVYALVLIFDGFMKVLYYFKILYTGSINDNKMLA